MDELDTPGVSRRSALKRAGLVAGGAAAVWAAPAVTSFGGAAFAAGTDPVAPGGATFDIEGFDGRTAPTGYSFFGGATALGEATFAFDDNRLPSLEGGQNPGAGSTYPFIAKNATAGTVTPPNAPGVVAPPNAVFGHPANTDGRRSSCASPRRPPAATAPAAP